MISKLSDHFKTTYTRIYSLSHILAIQKRSDSTVFDVLWKLEIHIEACANFYHAMIHAVMYNEHHSSIMTI